MPLSGMFGGRGIGLLLLIFQKPVGADSKFGTPQN